MFLILKITTIHHERMNIPLLVYSLKKLAFTAEYFRVFFWVVLPFYVLTSQRL